jgi:serine/threonine protein kinase
VYNHTANEISYIKIIDFGFSNYLSRLVEKSPAGTTFAIIELLAGTPNYIAPEILEMEGISLKIDNFAIGSVLYFMYIIKDKG